MQSDNTITLSADGDPSTFNMSLKVLRNIKDPGMIELIKYNFDDIDDGNDEDYNASTEPHGNLSNELRTKLNTLNAFLSEGKELYAMAKSDFDTNKDAVKAKEGEDSQPITDGFEAALTALNTALNGDDNNGAAAKYEQYVKLTSGVGYTQSEINAAIEAINPYVDESNGIGKKIETVSQTKAAFDNKLME